jgi:hypothetical protein
MQYKLKYHDLVLYFTGTLDLKEEVTLVQFYADEYIGSLWEDGTGWDVESQDVFLKDQVFKSKLLRTLFL